MKKLLIGLVGLNPFARRSVVESLIDNGRVQLVSYADGGEYHEQSRVKRLGNTLELLQGLPCDGMVISNIRCQQEADLLREKGGQVWHVMGGLLSNQVAIRVGDPLVSDMPCSDHPHWLDPIEALSEMLLRQPVEA
ncbi:hypothetical protein [Pseudomonas nitroreducens]|uniref:hypothetical protein n=1 Tax=Pseudomonas nitroreducens TaxID=46680 RepID=UPI0026585619|nr:hypothetical protein [Pseudomonas nitroreducens]MCP1652705.1 hypothetical protein [Pseudomonas nitroreducens]